MIVFFTIRGSTMRVVAFICPGTLFFIGFGTIGVLTVRVKVLETVRVFAVRVLAE